MKLNRRNFLKRSVIILGTALSIPHLSGCLQRESTKPVAEKKAPAEAVEKVTPAEEFFSKTSFSIYDITENSVKAKFVSPVPVLCTPTYGRTKEYGLMKVMPGMTMAMKEHEQRLIRLEPGTTYYLRGTVFTPNNEVFQSPVVAFSTAPTVKEVKSWEESVGKARVPEKLPASDTLSEEPVISATSNSANIEFKTTKPCFSLIAYGPTGEYGALSRSDEMWPVEKHAITLMDLQPATLYHYQIALVDSRAAVYVSHDLTFSTTEKVEGEGKMM